MLAQALATTVKKHPEKTAVVYNNLRISYAELYSNARGLCEGLNSIGIDQGDCIAVILPNCPEFIISFYAAARLKAIILPLNHLFKEDEIYYYINDSNVCVIITDTKQLDVCRRIIKTTGKKIKLIIIDGVQESIINFYDLILQVPEVPANEENCLPFEENLLYQYSSGSTGKPKKICRTQKNLFHEVNNFTATVGLTSADNILCVVPLYHAYGLGTCLLAAVYNGATLVMLEQFLQNGTPTELPFMFRCSRVLELMVKEQITICPAVPYVFEALVQAPVDARVDLSTLRLCISAGNFLPKSVFDKFLQKFNVPVRQLYGCTEAGSIAINLDNQLEKTYNSVGFPMKNVSLKIVDDEGKELPVDVSGEVVIASQALASGYHNTSKLSQQAFKEGWFLTGDLGKKDKFGRLYITGRKKILIDTGGRKVNPLEIEDVLMTHPEVKEVVVIGVKDPNAREVIKAVIVKNDLGNCEEQDIISYCKERFAEFKIPRIIEFRNKIPRNSLGKVLRKDLV
ncbi:class I adenylate-forming enzyme family protein [Gloeocapsopsis dulcis]|uniref:Acyl-CoA synthetase n=1 Tax=Gloeocapsopsis dulcis AAB1 = 1H9 TaxID=1433147 RepID=A0A6N8FTU5_9CHRO|nr:AMP-binding protein [Gloeocapsopsis dulcis]MUL36002.1 acyl-CoA synthetase [Gloeocapsopsis dulcis AAB1 = 1H9]WNN88255.1 AMP-binding protein [Gloeocapsopsis dulcis]